MKEASNDLIHAEVTSLESLLPVGMIDDKESEGSKNSHRALQVIEELIQEACKRNVLNARYALLQLFPRLEDEIHSHVAKKNRADYEISDFIRTYLTSLCPPWYYDFISALSEDETEIFLKNYVHAHELWGHPEGVAQLIRTMLEGSTHGRILVEVREIEGEKREIPGELRSRIGPAGQYAALGREFVLGRDFLSRPQRYDIRIGPISIRTLEKFQSAGWAVETHPSEKLYNLAKFAEPFYLHCRIHIILETVGFIIAKATIGKSKLGLAPGNDDELFNVLVETNTEES